MPHRHRDLAPRSPAGEGPARDLAREGNHAATAADPLPTIAAAPHWPARRRGEGGRGPQLPPARTECARARGRAAAVCARAQSSGEAVCGAAAPLPDLSAVSSAHGGAAAGPPRMQTQLRTPWSPLCPVRSSVRVAAGPPHRPAAARRRWVPTPPRRPRPPSRRYCSASPAARGGRRARRTRRRVGRAATAISPLLLRLADGRRREEDAPVKRRGGRR
ncbi:uncharacterized protein LOC120653639 [Panicum virgatum]|uniref:uncharacterized protein LOC120653639 n=1 Tax=Panicum virgatum TaxID=38727 RepID=UPI0019D5AA22|nr:uncharacterized protein LOC120653639 [Panicum virgatum]